MAVVHSVSRSEAEAAAKQARKEDAPRFAKLKVLKQRMVAASSAVADLTTVIKENAAWSWADNEPTLKIMKKACS